MATSTGAPYNLRYPTDTDVPDVPGDMGRLADDVATALDGKQTAGDATGLISADADNIAVLGSDDLVYVSPHTAAGADPTNYHFENYAALRDGNLTLKP